MPQLDPKHAHGQVETWTVWPDGQWVSTPHDDWHAASPLFELLHVPIEGEQLLDPPSPKQKVAGQPCVDGHAGSANACAVNCKCRTEDNAWTRSVAGS